MLSISAMSLGQENYYLSLAQESYFFSSGEPPGRWLGGGSSWLGLDETVSRDDLSQLFRGFHPESNSPLVLNAGSPARQPGWDLTFSPPKSVSVLWGIAPEDVQQAVLDCHRQAVTDSIAFLEDRFAYSRIGKGGRKQLPVKLFVAAFEHATSRELDPQLHTHCLVLNLGLNEYGNTNAIVSRHFYNSMIFLGSYYRASLAHRLQSTLNLKLYRPLDRRGKPKPWFELKVIPRRVLLFFSKRRQQIKKYLDAKGLESAAAAAFATLITRDPKSLIPPRQSLFESWRKDLKKLGFVLPKIRVRRRGHARVVASKKLRRCFDQAIDELTFSKNYFSLHEINRAALENSIAKGLSPDEVLAYVKNQLSERTDIIRIGIVDNREVWTTEEVLAAEEELLELAAKLHARRSRPVSEKHVSKAITKVRGLPGDGFKLDSEQAAALRHVTQDPGCLKIIRGLAGTGKTAMLEACREAFEKQGIRCIGATVSAAAAVNLEEKTDIPTKTIRLRELELYRSLIRRVRHYIRQLWRAARKLPTYKPSRLKLNSKTALIVDEAGTLSTRDAAMLFRAAETHGAQIVLTGDDFQLPSVERGGVLRSLASKYRHTRLTNVRRQRDELEKTLTPELANGNTELAFAHYAVKGKLKVCQTREDAQRQLVVDWARNGGTSNPSEHKIICSTNQEREELNRLCQGERLKKGELDCCKHLEWQDELFIVGDRVRFTSPDYNQMVINGDTGTIVGTKSTLFGKSLAVKLDGPGPRSFSERLKADAIELVHMLLRIKKPPSRPETVIVPLTNPFGRTYQSITLDYATTTHACQGGDFLNTYVHLGGGMTSKELIYVQATRHQDNLRLYSSESECGVTLTNMSRIANNEPLINPPPHRSASSSPLSSLANRTTFQPLATDIRDALKRRPKPSTPPNDRSFGRPRPYDVGDSRKTEQRMVRKVQDLLHLVGNRDQFQEQIREAERHIPL